jgi:hypothetical protein
VGVTYHAHFAKREGNHMISEYHITLRLTDEERAIIDRARGNTDLDTFAHNNLLAIAEEITDLDELTDDDDAELTTEDHLRLIAEAENDYMDLEEIEEHFRQRRAARHAANKVGVA